MPATVTVTAAGLSETVFGQQAAVAAIEPYLAAASVGLAPEGRPAGVFLLVGPTGTGKTHTTAATARALHSDPRAVLSINCGEFSLDHEVAKLIGAPPGYLGHRETQPMLSHTRIIAVTSPRSAYSVVLFDEIEKAAPSMQKLLLGIFDKGVLRLADGSTAKFEQSFIFLTSNLGATEAEKRRLHPMGLAAEAAPSNAQTSAVRKCFSPEFLNRIDEIVVYEPLSEAAIEKIALAEIEALVRQVARRTGIALSVSNLAFAELVREGFSPQYGARALKRTLHRRIMQPLAKAIADGTSRPSMTLAFDGMEFVWEATV